MNIFEMIRNDYIGNYVFVKNMKGHCVRAKITRIDVFCSKRHGDINIHIENIPSCYGVYTLYLGQDHLYEITNFDKAFLSKNEYNEYYKIKE